MKILRNKGTGGRQARRVICWLALSTALPLALRAQAQSTPPQTVQQQVTVTANRSASPIGETAKTLYQLDEQALHDYPAITLDDSLRQHAGLELFRRASSRIANPTSEGISLRGLGSTAASRTLVLEDGAPLNDPFGGYVHWDESPQQTIQSVTLVTGGGSDLYGSSALGGVIDVTPATSTPARFDASAAGGEEDTSDLQATAAGEGKRLGGLLAGQSIRTAGYITTAPGLTGTVDTPANVRSQAYRAELGRRNLATNRFFLTGNVLNEDRHNGTPLQTNATRLWRYLAGYDAPEKVLTGRARLFGSDIGYRQSFSSIAANRDSEALTRLQRVHTDELGATADATVHREHVAAVFGADVRDIRGEDNETPIAKGLPNGLADVTARQRYIGGFGELLGERGAWSGAASLRADRASNLDIVQTAQTGTGTPTSARPPNRNEIVLSPRAGLVRTFGPDVSVHASGFRAFREPSLNELYRTGQVGQEITLANPALTSERATGYEIGTQLSKPRNRASLQATYFWTEINRPVSAVLVSQTATTITEMRENLGQIRSRGAELALELLPTHPISASVGYQYADATITKFSAQPALVGNWIPQVPRHSATAQLRGTSSRLGQLTLAARFGGKAYDDTNNQFPLNSFFSLDVSGSRRFGPRLETFFLVQNLTDQRQQVSRTPILTLGTPVFAEAGVRLHLGKPVTP